MRKANLSELPCSLARTLQIVGEWWALLVLRDVCFGWNRFEEIHQHLGIARNILTSRLDTLAEQGMVTRSRYQDRPARYEYLPTEKALDLVPAIMALVAWGDKWTAVPPAALAPAALAPAALASASAAPAPGGSAAPAPAVRPGSPVAAGPPILFTHLSCGHDTMAMVVCSQCRAPLARPDLTFRPASHVTPVTQE